MSDVIEFCFRPRCDYDYNGYGPKPFWFLDPFTEDELWPRLYCPACGKPRWLYVDSNEFVRRFSLDIEPRGVFIEPAGGFLSDGFRSQVTDVWIGVSDTGSNNIANLWDIRVRGERSVRESFGLGLPDTCEFGPDTPCERMVCWICGNTRWQELTAVLTRPGDVVYVCRHGHFQGEQLHPFTGMSEHLTGPKMLDSLVWAPELFVPRLKWRWWEMPLFKGAGCYVD